MVLAIDGPAGAGKTTIAKELARQLGFCLLDSGALYRTMALALIRAGVDPDVEVIPSALLDSINIKVIPSVGGMAITLDAEDVSSEIRSEKIGSAASRFSVRPEVRRSLMDIQRSLSNQCHLVAEGRDMGAIVFPCAQVKFFLTADPEERARRRYEELIQKGEKMLYSDILSEMRVRDCRDRTRSIAPLTPARDATIIDTSNKAPDQIVQMMLEQIRATIGALK